MEQHQELTHILLVDSNVWFRQGIRALLEANANHLAVEEAATAAEALAKAEQRHPDAVIIDAELMGSDWQSVASALRRHSPKLRLVVLDGTEERQYAVATKNLGGVSHVAKADAGRQVVAHICRPSNGSMPDRTKEDLGKLATAHTPAGSAAQNGNGLPLTNRENEVLSLLVDGYTVKQIATELNLSVKTVEAHKFNLMRKLDVHSRGELLHRVNQNRTTPVPAVA